MTNHLEALHRIGKPRLLVLGDLMLDRYTWGSAGRVSPEAPVLVLAAEREEVRLGGASSVAGLLHGLDAEVVLAGVVGSDGSGRIAQRLFEEARIDARLVTVDPARPTTTKERFLGRAASRHAHQILRVDRETCAPIDAGQEEQLAAAIGREVLNCQAVLISDYAKGVCTPGLVQAVIRACNQANVPVLVDPARGADYRKYHGASVVKPNRVEAAEAWNAPINTPQEALLAGEFLCREFHFEAAVVTLDQEGMAVAVPGQPGRVFPTKARSVYDITGAGDMALAMLGLCQASGLDLAASVELANVAAGLQVERLGVEQITRAEIFAESNSRLGLQTRPGERVTQFWTGLESHPTEKAQFWTGLETHPTEKAQGWTGLETHPTEKAQGWTGLESHPTEKAQFWTGLETHPTEKAQGWTGLESHPTEKAEGWTGLESHPTEKPQGSSKLITTADLPRLAAEHRQAGRRVVFTNGCFDLLHVGHVSYLQEAAALGDVLIVGVNSDAGVRRLKGPTRPIIGEHDRAAMLSALGCVSQVVIFDDDTPHALLSALRPDVLVKGGTYTEEEIVGREVVTAYGGLVCIVGQIDGVSTTRILAGVQSLHR